MSANTAQPDTPYGYTPEGKNTGVVKSKGKPTLHLADGSAGVPLRARKPEWLKVRAPGGPNYLRLQKMMREQRLHTVCEEAHCPNIGECWESGTATFIILGDVCTRACKYCAVAHGLPTELDLDEPRRVADSVEVMGLEHAVITSVNRDELKDGGASIFAETIRQIHARVPGCSVEVLIAGLPRQRGCGSPGGGGEAGDLRTQRGHGGAAGARGAARCTLLALHLRARRHQADGPVHAHQERDHPRDGRDGGGDLPVDEGHA